MKLSIVLVATILVLAVTQGFATAASVDGAVHNPANRQLPLVTNLLTGLRDLLSNLIKQLLGGGGGSGGSEGNDRQGNLVANLLTGLRDLLSNLLSELLGGGGGSGGSQGHDRVAGAWHAALKTLVHGAANSDHAVSSKV